MTNPQPGELDFRGYVDQNDLYRRAAEGLEQATDIYEKLWNVIAESVGAPKVFFEENQGRYVYR